MCGVMINGDPHGPQPGTATCQLHMRKFTDGDSITIEPWRASSMPVIKDLIVDRSPFDRIVEAGGYISVNTGAAPDANIIAVPKEAAEAAMDAAACIGCAACVAACPNSAANLFTAAKIQHLNLLPRASLNASPALLRWWKPWRNISVRAPTTVSAKAHVQRTSQSTSLPG